MTSRFDKFDNSDAYAVAGMIHEMRINEGAKRVGRKIGFTNPEMWSVYGVREPIWSFVYDTTTLRLSDQHGLCNIGRFVEPKLEPDIVLHFAPRQKMMANQKKSSDVLIGLPMELR